MISGLHCYASRRDKESTPEITLGRRLLPNLQTTAGLLCNDQVVLNLSFIAVIQSTSVTTNTSDHCHPIAACIALFALSHTSILRFVNRSRPYVAKATSKRFQPAMAAWTPHQLGRMAVRFCEHAFARHPHHEFRSLVLCADQHRRTDAEPAFEFHRVIEITKAAGKPMQHRCSRSRFSFDNLSCSC